MKKHYYPIYLLNFINEHEIDIINNINKPIIKKWI